MKILDLIFYRLLFLYRKEKKGAVDSASNYLAAIILVAVGSVVGTFINILFRPVEGWEFKPNRSTLFLIVVPVFFALSYGIKKYYEKRIVDVEAVKLGKKLKFNLFSLWVMIVIVALLTVFIPKLVRGE